MTDPIETARAIVVAEFEAYWVDENDATDPDGAIDAYAAAVRSAAVAEAEARYARLVEAASRLEHQSLSCAVIESVTYCYCPLKNLTAALRAIEGEKHE